MSESDDGARLAGAAGVGVMLQEAKEKSAGFVNLQEIAVDS